MSKPTRLSGKRFVLSELDVMMRDEESESLVIVFRFPQTAVLGLREEIVARLNLGAPLPWIEGPVAGGEMLDSDSLQDWVEEMYSLTKEAAGCYEHDTDGIQPLFVDRTRFEHMHYEAVPYSHHPNTDWDWRLRVASINIGLAREQADRTLMQVRDKLLGELSTAKDLLRKQREGKMEDGDWRAVADLIGEADD